MSNSALPALTFNEIDDILYFTRANEVQDLQTTVADLAQKHQVQPGNILRAAVDPESGNTVLHYCAANGFVDSLPSLLTQLGDAPSTTTANRGITDQEKFVSRANKEGNTPLHWAAYNGNLEIVKLLVSAGCDMWIKNAAGHLAIFEAERADKNEVVQYLLEAGGKEVERTGTEGVATAQDLDEVHDDETNGDTTQPSSDATVDMSSGA